MRWLSYKEMTKTTGEKHIGSNVKKVILPPVHFIWRKLELHGLLDYALTIHLLYIILVMGYKLIIIG
jgi:hypothetical protein